MSRDKALGGAERERKNSRMNSPHVLFHK